MFKIYFCLLFGEVISFPTRKNTEENEIETNLLAADLSYLGEKVFGKPNNESGENLSKWKEDSLVNPEEVGEYAEGDILFPSAKRNGLIAKTSRWKDGVVPYEILGFFTLSDLDLIHRAMDQYHKLTCIKYCFYFILTINFIQIYFRFRKRNIYDDDFIVITNQPTGCWSSVGRIGGRQEVNLQSPGCLSKIGTPIHELMHALGFVHEQNRWERDDHVTIIWSNIKSGK